MSNTLFVVQSLSRLLLFATPWSAEHQAFLSFTISQSLFKFMSIELVMLSNHLILCHPLLLLPSIHPSILVSSNESASCIRWSQYWSFSNSPSQEYSELISFRIDWFDLEIFYKTYLCLIYIFHKIYRFKYRLLSLPSLCFLLVPSVFLLPLSFFLLLDKSSILRFHCVSFVNLLSSIALWFFIIKAVFKRVVNNKKNSYIFPHVVTLSNDILSFVQIHIFILYGFFSCLKNLHLTFLLVKVCSKG